MLIAHAPTGYIINHAYNKVSRKEISFVKFGLIFSVWPDFDLIYFYLLDKSSTFHHLYFTHLPIVWMACVILALPLKNLKSNEKIKDLYYLLLINWFVHLVLDTVTGGIAWFYPFNSEIFKLIEIPATYSNWIFSFILHWSFLIELFITIYAISLGLKNKKSNKREE